MIPIFSFLVTLHTPFLYKECQDKIFSDIESKCSDCKVCDERKCLKK